MNKNAFSKQQNGLLALLSIKSIGSEFDFSGFSIEEWMDLYQECRAQSVELIAFDAIKTYMEPPQTGLLDTWQKTALTVFSRNLLISYTQTQVVRLLEKHQIRYAIIKGAASAAYYEKPELRMQGDIDVIVFNEIDKASQILQSENFIQKEQTNYHIKFEKDNVRLELHSSFAGIPQNEMGQKILQYMNGCSTNHTSGYQKLDDPFHGMCILLHFVHHMYSGGVGLRHLLDWVWFVEKTAHFSFWQKELLPKLKEFGLLRIACEMTNIGVEYLHATKPKWLEERSVWSEKLLMEIFKCGNFGRKDTKRIHSGYMISVESNAWVWNAIKSLHKYTVKHELVRKCALLYPFIYVYRICRYFFMVLCGKRYSLRKLTIIANERSAVYENLHIFDPHE